MCRNDVVSGKGPQVTSAVKFIGQDMRRLLTVLCKVGEVGCSITWMQSSLCHRDKMYKNICFPFLLSSFLLAEQGDLGYRAVMYATADTRMTSCQFEYKPVLPINSVKQPSLIFTVIVYAHRGKKKNDMNFPPFWGHLFMVTVAGKDLSEGGCHWDKLHHEVGQLSWVCSEWMMMTQPSCHLTADSKSAFFIQSKQTAIKLGMWVSKSDCKQNDDD